VLVEIMDSFEGITEFVALAQLQSFTAAGKQLGCSTSHVSRQVARLEQRLGCALVARTTRLVSLTDAGALYYQQCKELVAGLAQANEQVNSHQYQLKGTLRVSAAGTFAEVYVVPALVEFAKAHPDLTIDINFNSRLTNFVEEGYDFVLRYGKLSDSDLIARKLVSRAMVAMASPEYLAKFGRPQTPDQLKQHRCIITNNEYWSFEHEGVSSRVKVSGNFYSNNASAALHACSKGLGILYLPKSSTANLIEEGVLVPILEPYWDSNISTWIVYQNRQFLPTRARVAIEYLLNYFSNWQE